MKKDCMISAVRAYLAGEITRDALSVKIKNHRAATQLRCASYSDLLLDGIEQKLSAVPEQSYGDGELKHVLDVLEGRASTVCHVAYVIPPKMIDDDCRKLMAIVEAFLENLEIGKTYPIKVGVRMTSGEYQYHNADLYLTQADYDFCEKMYNVLANAPQDTVVTSVALHLLSMINRYMGFWGSVTTYFATEGMADVGGSKALRQSVEALDGKRPVYVSLYGLADQLHATIVL